MSTNRMWLEHVDTGERVLLAKFNGGAWYVPTAIEPSIETRLDVVFSLAHASGHVYRDGIFWPGKAANGMVLSVLCELGLVDDDTYKGTSNGLAERVRALEAELASLRPRPDL